MELITLKCPHPNCKNTLVLELLEKDEPARFKTIGSIEPSIKDVILVSCPSPNHTFYVSFGSIYRTSFESQL